MRAKRFLRRLALALAAAAIPACGGGGGGSAPAASAFDSLGRLTTAFGPAMDRAHALGIQADGKFVLAGFATDALGNSDIALARYNADGTLDPTFGVGGKVITPVTASSSNNANALAIQPDGRIVIAGSTFVSGFFQVVVLRYNPDGSLDLTFDTDGIVTANPNPGNDTGEGVAIQPDGKIVVAGTNYTGPSGDFLVLRFNADGSPDTGFDADGFVLTSFGAEMDSIEDVALQADGKIVVAGYTASGGNFNIAVARYNTNGSLDTGFDTDGTLISPVGTGNDFASSVAIQADGKIVVGGQAIMGTAFDFAVVRYNVDGSLDTTFDTDGIVTTAIGPTFDIGASLLIQPDGKIVLGGRSNSGSLIDLAFVRYNVDGSLDTTFDTDGKLTVTFGTGNAQANDIGILPNGKLVAACEVDTGADLDFGLWRQP
jgi:uncharacterized delta-60 repeat protein